MKKPLAASKIAQDIVSRQRWATFLRRPLSKRKVSRSLVKRYSRLIR